MRPFRFLILLFPIFSVTSSFAKGFSSSEKMFYLGTGALFYNMGKVTSSNTASTSMLGQFYIPLTLSAKIPFTDSLAIMPVVGYTPLGAKAADSVSKKILNFGVNCAFESSPVIDLKGGLGYMVYSISGDGSAVTRSNGTSTATFYLPGSTKSSKNIYLDLGIAYRFNGFRIDIDAIALDAFSARRAISGLFTFSMGVF